jgi:hypothetical protein
MTRFVHLVAFLMPTFLILAPQQAQGNMYDVVEKHKLPPVECANGCAAWADVAKVCTFGTYTCILHAAIGSGFSPLTAPSTRLPPAGEQKYHQDVGHRGGT